MGAIIWGGQLSRGQFSGCNYPMGKLSVGAIVREQLSRGTIILGAIVQEAIIRWAIVLLLAFYTQTWFQCETPL